MCLYLCAAHSTHMQITEAIGIVVICPPSVLAWGQKSGLLAGSKHLYLLSYLTNSFPTQPSYYLLVSDIGNSAVLYVTRKCSSTYG